MTTTLLTIILTNNDSDEGSDGTPDVVFSNRPGRPTLFLVDNELVNKLMSLYVKQNLVISREILAPDVSQPRPNTISHSFRRNTTLLASLINVLMAGLNVLKRNTMRK